MRALSVRQPWAWLIVHGWKSVENRSWTTPHRGPLLIHASKTPDLTRADLQDFASELAAEGIILPLDLPTSGIVGVVNLVDCVLECTDEQDLVWHQPGLWAWLLRQARPLPFTPCTGRLHLFEVDLALPDEKLDIHRRRPRRAPRRTDH